MIKDMISLTKPRLLQLNVFASLAGFWIASRWSLDWGIMLWMLIGTTLTIASACVMNNYWDYELDQRMERTRERAEPIDRLSLRFVFGYSIVLGVIGIGILFLLVNPVTGLLGLLAWFVYVVVYTMWLKRSSTWSTSIGGIAGSMPPVMGYCAVRGEVDLGAWLLFIFLFLWQPAHFWSLGIRRVEEYRVAGFPLLPVVKGVRRTKLQMIPYVLLLIPAGILLFAYGYTGYIFLVVSVIGGVAWLVHTISGLRVQENERWAKVNFMFSVNYLMIMFILMVVDTPRL